MTEQVKIAIATVLTIAGTIMYCVSNFLKTKKGVTYLRAWNSLTDCLKYLVLGARTGIVNGVLDVGKNLAFSKFDSMKLTTAFTVVRVIALIAGYDSFVTILYIVIEIWKLLILKSGTVQQFRIISLANTFLFVLYDFRFATKFIASLTTISFVCNVIAVIQGKKGDADDKGSAEQGGIR